MTSEFETPIRGPGAFQWNTAGWFGAQIGSTCWMAAIGIAAWSSHLEAAVVAGAAFIICNAFGTWLWLRRARIAPYPAIQTLLATLAVISAILILVTSSFLGGHATKAYAAWLVFPWLMIRFHSMESRARREPTS